MQADKPSEIRFAQEGITLNILLVASLGASVLKIRFPTMGIIASCSRFAWCKRAKDTITQCGNKTFPRWEYIRCYSIAQADKSSEE